MKENAIKDIKNSSIKISIEAVENIIKNSIDKKKLETLYSKNLEQAKVVLKKTIIVDLCQQKPFTKKLMENL